MYTPRHLTATFQHACRRFPAVLITGPRQSGKTTFLRHAAPPDAAYVSFDDPLQRAFAREDPRGLLQQFADRPVIFDEIQYVPELLVYLKMAIDERRDAYGRFLLSGSQQFELMRGVSESLAGRVAVLELLPFSERELHAVPVPLPQTLWLGGYPDPRLRPDSRDLWLSSYVRTYVERDVRQVRDIQDLRTFEQFLSLAAARHGQEFGKAALARACGVSEPTIAAWTSVLAASYVVSLLPPWHRNLGKRIIKRPKLYFIDPALVCWLTRQPSADAALAGPLRGALLEGLIVNEARKAFAAVGQPSGCSYWRSQGGLEVDLILELGGQVVPVEIKSTATPNPGHIRPLQRFAKLLEPREIGPMLLVCDVAERTPLPGGAIALPWREWSVWLAEALTD